MKSEKFEIIRKDLKITQEEMATYFGFHTKNRKSSYAKLEKGTTNLSISSLSSLLENLPELNVDWLLRDEGEMWKGEKNEVNEPQQEYFTKNYFDIRVLVERVRELERRVEELEKGKK